jgi:hypothetical protein
MKTLILILLALPAGAAVSVYFPKDEPKLQADFLARTTVQYEATVTRSAFFSDVYNVNVKAIKPNYVRPTPPDGIPDATAFDRCFVHGWSFGVDYERADTNELLAALQSDAIKTKTCGGLISGTTVAADAFVHGCAAAYNVAISTITEKTSGIPPVPVPPLMGR